MFVCLVQASEGRAVVRKDEEQLYAKATIVIVSSPVALLITASNSSILLLRFIGNDLGSWNLDSKYLEIVLCIVYPMDLEEDLLVVH